MTVAHRRRHPSPHVAFADVVGLLVETETDEVDVEAIRQKHCGAKIRYGRDSARAVANRLSQQNGAAYEAYGCIFCSAWHVGHVASVAWLGKLAAVLRLRSA